jgi:excisionase family DNA binding protein
VHPKQTSGAVEDSMRARIAAELNELPPTITVERAARLLGLSRSAAYRAAATGQLPTLAFGRRRVVPTFRLMQMLGMSEEASH